jgi:hypothetical protein
MPTGRSRWWPTTSRLTASSRVVPATRSEAWRSRSEKLRKLRLGTRGRTSKVRRSEEEITAATIERQPLWNDRKTDHGPFDIVGDVHVGEGSASGAVPCACDGRRGACGQGSFVAHGADSHHLRGRRVRRAVHDRASDGGSHRSRQRAGRHHLVGGDDRQGRRRHGGEAAGIRRAADAGPCSRR